MLGKWLPKTTLILPALCLSAVPLFAQSQSGSAQQTGDPVADAARKAREDKKTAPKAKKVYTEDDIPKAPRTGEQAPGTAADSQGQPAQGQAAQGQASKAGTAQGAGAASTAAGSAAPAEKNDEAAWRARFKAQNDKIARAEKELDILQREVDRAQMEYYPDPQKALKEQHTRSEINEKNAKIAAKKKDLEALKQGLNDLEDQLRKSGGNPGWARE